MKRKRDRVLKFLEDFRRLYGDEFYLNDFAEYLDELGVEFTNKELAKLIRGRVEVVERGRYVKYRIR